MIYFNIAYGHSGGATTLERVHPVKMHNNIIYTDSVVHRRRVV